MARRCRSERRSSTRGLKPKPAASSPWPNIEAFVEYDGNINIGRIAPIIDCAAVAADDHNMLAALVRRPGETFTQLLDRLDHAIDQAVNHDIFTDEING